MGSFAALRRQRNAREQAWAVRTGETRTSSGGDETVLPVHGDSRPQGEAQSSGPVASADTIKRAGDGSKVASVALDTRVLEAFATKDRGRGLRVAKDAPQVHAGDTLLCDQPLVSVLSTTQAAARCHYCFTRDKLLQRCSGCRFARYCSVACQRAAWTYAEHRDECRALRVWFRAVRASHGALENTDMSEYEPGTTIRALARVLWQRKHSREIDAAWRQVYTLESHATELDAEQRAAHAQTAYRLARFLRADTPEALDAYGLGSAEDLVGLVDRVRPCGDWPRLPQKYAVNAFTRADAHLDPIGVCISVPVALINHSCAPNAVVVFAEEAANSGGAGGPERSLMRVVALRPIPPEEEVVTSYVDLSESRAKRQRTLRERYLFGCTCALCQRGTEPAGHASWTDPREALRCGTTGCPGWVSVPQWAGLDPALCPEGPLSSTSCNRCNRRTDIKDPSALFALLRTADALNARLAREMGAAAPRPESALTGDPVAYEHVRSCAQQLSVQLAPSHTLLWALMHSAHVMAIERALEAESQDAQRAASYWEDGAQLVLLLCAGMQAPGTPGDARSALYPPGHPVRAVLFATLGRLLVSGAPQASGSPAPLAGARLPPERSARLMLARQALLQALDEAKIGFGQDVNSAVRSAAAAALADVDAEHAAIVRAP